jgi:hypothetical protein
MAFVTAGQTFSALRRRRRTPQRPVLGIPLARDDDASPAVQQYRAGMSVQWFVSMMESAISPPISAAATIVVADWPMVHSASRFHHDRRWVSGSAWSATGRSR